MMPAPERWRRVAWSLVLRLVVTAVTLVIPSCYGQQSYVNNHQADCYNDRFNYTTKGYKCNADDQIRSPCKSYLTFRVAPPYNSTALIAYLLGAQESAPLIASLNNISSDTAAIQTDSLVVIPVNCSCYAGQYYQHNATYALKSKSETYFTVANNTYQGLSTCQALMAQNPWESHNLSVGLLLQVPLRCACPTPNQTAQGVKYLLTYLVTWGNSVSSIAQLFGGAGATEESTMYANELSSDLIFPFTPLLIPLTTEPTANTRIQVPPPPSPSPPQTPVVPVAPNSTSNSHTWVYVGAGIGLAALLIVVAVSAFLFKKSRRKLQKPKPENPTETAPPPTASNATTNTASSSSKSWSLSSTGVVLNAIESLTVYKFQDLEVATANFSLANRIKGSVYKGSFKGDAAAIKVMKGDVSQEINILKKINHSNIIRLSGFCVHQGNTYLVYEYAENGSLSDALHSRKFEPLAWKQRVHIAYDVADALNYLHNYTNPPYIHKNLKSSNILLDASLRAKVANFGLARMLSEDDGHNGGVQLTRHVVGTQGYMAPEYVENGVITPKLDVFAFGVILVELISGKEAAANRNRGEDELLAAGISRVLQGNNVRDKLRDFLDPCLREEYPLELVYSMAQLAKNCVSHDLNDRPSMSQVFATLSKILSSSMDWDPSDELQRTGSRNY